MSRNAVATPMPKPKNTTRGIPGNTIYGTVVLTTTVVVVQPTAIVQYWSTEWCSHISENWTGGSRFVSLRYNTIVQCKQEQDDEALALGEMGERVVSEVVHYQAWEYSTIVVGNQYTRCKTCMAAPLFNN